MSQRSELPAINGCYSVTPSLFFTIAGNTKSEKVLELLSGRIGENARCVVFESPQEIEEVFSNKVDPSAAVFLFDNYQGRKKEFIHRTSTRERDKRIIPEYAHNIPWSVQITSPNINISRCVSQIFADFSKNFLDRVQSGIFPWGLPRSQNRKNRKNLNQRNKLSFNYH